MHTLVLIYPTSALAPDVRCIILRLADNTIILRGNISQVARWVIQRDTPFEDALNFALVLDWHAAVHIKDLVHSRSMVTLVIKRALWYKPVSASTESPYHGHCSCPLCSNSITLGIWPRTRLSFIIASESPLSFPLPIVRSGTELPAKICLQDYSIPPKTIQA